MRSLAILGFLAASLFAQSPPLMLGALEDTHGTRSEDTYFRSVRAIFYKGESGWMPLPADCIHEACLRKLETDFPRETTWTIAYDGRKVGQVKTRIPAELEDYARAGQQQILSKLPIPTIGTRTAEFAGFLDDPVYRPLVAISQPNFKDPDLWKPVTVDSATATMIRQEFHKKYPKITDCEQEDLQDYLDTDIKILSSYTSRSGWRLIATSIKGCDIEDLRGDGLSLEWFAVGPDATVHYLHGNMRLVDAGDYDNSGHSQLLFMIDDYNRGGYRLYYDNFQKEAAFEYSFH